MLVICKSAETADFPKCFGNTCEDEKLLKITKVSTNDQYAHRWSQMIFGVNSSANSSKIAEKLHWE